MDAAGESGESAEEYLFTPFHTYSMADAIEDGHVLDVLQDYTTIAPHVQVLPAAGVDDETSSNTKERKSTAVVQRVMQAAANHVDVVRSKSEYIADHFLEQLKSGVPGASCLQLPSLPAEICWGTMLLLMVMVMVIVMVMAMAMAMAMAVMRMRMRMMMMMMMMMMMAMAMAMAMAMTMAMGTVMLRLRLMLMLMLMAVVGMLMLIMTLFLIAASGDVRAMVVARSRQHVVWYVLELRRILSDKKHRRVIESLGLDDIGVYGAFSGTVPLTGSEDVSQAEVLEQVIVHNDA